MLMLCVWSVFLAGVYMYAVSIELWAVTHVYAISGGLLFVAYYFTNGGFGRRDYGAIERPEDMSDAEYRELIEKLKQRQKLAKYFLVGFIPFVFIVCIDYLVILWL